jgi:hypothetical protein
VKTLNLHRYGPLRPATFKRNKAGLPTVDGLPARKGVFCFPQHCDDRGYWLWKYMGYGGDGDLLQNADKRGRRDHRQFRYRGLVWCHLDHLVRSHEVVARHGTWVCVTTSTLAKYLPQVLSSGMRTDGALCELFIEARDFKRGFRS